MTAPGGTLFLGSMMLGDPELADFARFVPRSYFRDPTWWWVPGRAALHAMIEAPGFEIETYFGEAGARRRVPGHHRLFSGTPPGLSSAASGPTGLLHDPWLKRFRCPVSSARSCCFTACGRRERRRISTTVITLFAIGMAAMTAEFALWSCVA